MIGFAESFLVWTASTIIPGFMGLLVITWVGRKLMPTYIVAFSLGIFFWFFADTLSSSAGLDVNLGFNGGFAQLGVVVLFIAGFFFFIMVDRNRGIFAPESAIGKYGMIIPILAAIAVGVHGLGEGAAYGATAANPTISPSLIDAFGGITAGVAYVLHKVLEPMMIGAVYVAYANGKSARIASWLRNLLALTILFVLPSLIGAATGYFYEWNATYAFALGTGTSIYVLFRLAAPLFLAWGDKSRQTLGIAVAWTLGFMAIYCAALFHS